MEDLDTNDARVPCPLCLELIREGAIKCRFCKSDLRREVLTPAPAYFADALPPQSSQLTARREGTTYTDVEAYEPQPESQSSRGVLWLIFMAPGAVILWFEYFFPERGNVLASGRRYGNPIIQVFYSISFYFTLIVGIIMLAGSKR